MMWNRLHCYLSGRHEFGMWCEPGAIFLRCVHCGTGSSGWTVDTKPMASTILPTPLPKHCHDQRPTRVLPFSGTAAADAHAVPPQR